MATLPALASRAKHAHAFLMRCDPTFPPHQSRRQTLALFGAVGSNLPSDGAKGQRRRAVSGDSSTSLQRRRVRPSPQLEDNSNGTLGAGADPVGGAPTLAEDSGLGGDKVVASPVGGSAPSTITPGTRRRSVEDAGTVVSVGQSGDVSKPVTAPGQIHEEPESVAHVDGSAEAGSTGRENAMSANSRLAGDLRSGRLRKAAPPAAGSAPGSPVVAAAAPKPAQGPPMMAAAALKPAPRPQVVAAAARKTAPVLAAAGGAASDQGGWGGDSGGTPRGRDHAAGPVDTPGRQSRQQQQGRQLGQQQGQQQGQEWRQQQQWHQQGQQQRQEWQQQQSQQRQQWQQDRRHAGRRGSDATIPSAPAPSTSGNYHSEEGQSWTSRGSSIDSGSSSRNSSSNSSRATGSMDTGFRRCRAEGASQGDPWHPVLASLQGRGPGAPSGWEGGAAAVMVSMLTAPPAQAVAAAACSLAADFHVIYACRTGGATAQAVSSAAAAAADAAAAAYAAGMAVASTSGNQATAAAPTAVAPNDAVPWPRRSSGVRGRTVKDTTDSSSSSSGSSSTGSSSTGSSSTGSGSGGAVAAANGSLGVLWPLLPDQLLRLATWRGYGGTCGSGGGDGSSDELCSGVSSYRGSRGSSSTLSTNRGPERGAHDDEDEEAAVAAATAILEAVSYAVLERGVYPVRDAITRLRASIRMGAEAARGAAAAAATPSAAADAAEVAEALQRMKDLLAVPDVVHRTAVEGAVSGAPYMSAGQVAAVLAAMGPSALMVGPEAASVLAQRAMKLLAAGTQQQQQHKQGGSEDGDAWFGVGEGGIGDEGYDRGTKPAAAVSTAQRPLPAPLVALLMLLLVTVLPRELAHQQARWTMWHQLRAILLQPAADQAAAAAATATGQGDRQPSPPQPPQQLLPRRGRARARVAAAAEGEAELRPGRGGGAVLVAAADGGGRRPQQRQLPLVAVAALLVAAKRLQVHMEGSEVEEAAMSRVTRGSDELTGRQVATLLRCLTAEQVMLGSDALDRIASRLSRAAGAGELDPAEAVAVLESLAAQLHPVSREELAGLMGFLFEVIAELAATEQEAAPGAAAATATRRSSGYSLPYMASVCSNVEVLLGRLQPVWSDPNQLTTVRDELARFSASCGAHPGDAVQSWQSFIRSSSRPAAASARAASLDGFIDEARRELLRSGSGGPGALVRGESMLDRVLATTESGPGGEEEGGGEESGAGRGGSTQPVGGGVV